MWGSALIADDSGPTLGDPTLNYSRLHPIASDLSGRTLIAAASDGSVRVFPRQDSGGKPVLAVPPGSECLCLGATKDLVIRDSERLAIHHFNPDTGEWDERPHYAWPDVDASTVVRAFLVPHTDGTEDLALLFRDGSLNEAAQTFLASLGLPRLRDLDLLRQDDGVWVAAVAAEGPASTAVTARRLGQTALEPLSFSHQRLYDDDTISQALWARGSQINPLLVVVLGGSKPSNLNRRIRSNTGTWKDLS